MNLADFFKHLFRKNERTELPKKKNCKSSKEAADEALKKIFEQRR